MEKWRAEIKNKWMSHAPGQYWGDDLDVRYYLVKKMQGLHGKKVLDIGCNIGMIIGSMPVDNDKVGIDYDKEFIEKAKAMDPGCRFNTGDARNIPERDGTFDAILLVNILECFAGEDRLKVLLEAKRLLKKGGIAYITTPNGNHFYYAKKSKIKRAELDELLKKSGLTYSITGFNPVPLPVKLIKWIPGIFGLLEYLCKKKILVDRCRYFYVEATK